MEKVIKAKASRKKKAKFAKKMKKLNNRKKK